MTKSAKHSLAGGKIGNPVVILPLYKLLILDHISTLHYKVFKQLISNGKIAM